MKSFHIEQSDRAHGQAPPTISENHMVLKVVTHMSVPTTAIASPLCPGSQQMTVHCTLLSSCQSDLRIQSKALIQQHYYANSVLRRRAGLRAAIALLRQGPAFPWLYSGATLVADCRLTGHPATKSRRRFKSASC